MELLDEADEVRRVHLVRGQRGRCRARRGRALVVEDHRRLVFAARRHARLARARRRRLPGGGHAAGIRARRPANESPRTGRFSPPATRAGVCASAVRTSTDERGDDRCSVSRATSQQRRGRGRIKLTLDPYVDPYGAANNSYRRNINVHPASDPLPGSLASACDPSGGEGVGTGRVR